MSRKKKIDLREYQSKDSYRVSFNLGETDESLTLVCWKDDGTWGKHLTVEYRDMPWSTFPIINNQGLLNLVLALINMYEVYSGDKEFFKPLER